MKINNHINGANVPAKDGGQFIKYGPGSGKELFQVARSGVKDVNKAMECAAYAQSSWAKISPIQRGNMLFRIAELFELNKDDLAKMISDETGRNIGDAHGEIGAAIQCARFFAAEGQRMYGKTTTSGMSGRTAATVRYPKGIAALIVAANTPLANVSWKLFPALICGNAVVLKAAEDTPGTAWMTAKLAKEAGIPDGVYNVIQGIGKEAGQYLIEHHAINVISFTGSSMTGKHIAKTVAERMIPLSLELGGKNALVICSDADINNAVKWSILSSFSNAGQRCAASSRIIIEKEIYDSFKDKFVQETEKIKVGIESDCLYGAVINEKQLQNMLSAIEIAQSEGANLITGGKRVEDECLKKGYFLKPTILENCAPESSYNKTELFGPITALYRVENYDEALAMTNESPYGLTACIHTNNLAKAMDFTRNANVGVVSINAGTHGSEAHMPFGGTKNSGNGSREPGTEALDIYSNLKDVYTLAIESQLYQ